MLIEIHLRARLLRIPLLRVEGVVALRDDETQHTSPSSAARPKMIETMPRNVRGAAADRTPLGRDLAEAEAIISAIEGSGSH